MTDDIRDVKSLQSAATQLGFSTISSSVLSYLGDAAYELYVRKYVFDMGAVKPDLLNRETVRYVRAESQALAYDAIYDELDELEKGVARRGKNHKITSMPHNLDTMTYKKATGFEALIGYLFLEERAERIKEVLEKAFKIIEAEPETANMHCRKNR